MTGRGVLSAIAVLMAVWAALAASAGTTDAGETYDLIFREGALDGLERDRTLVYDHAVANRLDPAAGETTTAEVALSFAEPDRARLTLREDAAARAIGDFPAEIGNPIVMYFVESVVRDLAEASGGSPFYIRNRVREALARPAEIAPAGTGAARTVTLRPFADDPNAARSGFDALVLTFTLSDGVPGWYQEMAASLGDGDAVLYSSILTARD